MDRTTNTSSDSTHSTPKEADTIPSSTPIADWPLSYIASWVLLFVLLFVAIAWFRYTSGDSQIVQLTGVSTVAISALTAALATTHLVRIKNPPLRTGWVFMAIGLWFVAIGEVLWIVYPFLIGSVSYPSLIDVFYLASYPFLIVGIIKLGFDQRDTRPYLRFILDGLVVAAASFALPWHFIFGPLLSTSPLVSLETVVSLAYPLFDTVLVSIALVIAMNVRGPRRIPLLIVTSGFGLWMIADIMYSVAEFTGGYSYSPVGIAWLVGYLLIVLGVVHPDTDASLVPGRRRQFRLRELTYIFIPFLVAMVLFLALGYMNALGDGDIVIAGITIILLVIRHMYIFTETTRIGRALEDREATLARRNEELLLVNRIVRHDIRNDMTVAYGWANELRGHVGPEGEQMLERVARSTQHTVDLTETLRDFVDALESEDQALIQSISLRSHLREPIREVKETHPEANFTTDEIPDATVEANELLGTVFRNLLENAVKHNDASTPEITVTAETTGSVVRVRIADNGPGVPDDQKDAVFGRGEKGLESSGSGIGLYLVDTLIGQYDGEVWIEDADPTGAIFIVELNLVE